jgi:NCS1 family nucleobase:cation symporter-1
VGWNPYASDYTRYFKPESNKVAIALWAGFGLLLSCVLLETVGAAAGTIAGVTSNANPTAGWTGIFPTWLSDLTLIAIVIGGIAANALNIYSGAISFTALGFKLPLAARRAIVALGFGAIGSDYNNFLLIISYWIAPWLAVMFCDMFLRRRQDPAQIERLLFDRKYTNWAGPVAMAVGVGLSIWLFSNQTKYVGLVPSHNGNFGDLTFEVGFVLTGAIYLTWRLIADRSARTA